MHKDTYSFVIPVFNESSSLGELYEEISAAMHSISKDFEVIFVNDGSRDDSQLTIDTLFEKHPDYVRGIQLRNNFGKAAALQAGFKMAAGSIIITLDADLQDDPNEIHRFINKLHEGYDLVSGWKQNRKDSFIKNSTSFLFNTVTNYISEVQLHDYNCGFKAYRAEVIQGLDLYGELHRYIPVIAASQGFRVTEIPVHHRKRKYGESKYGPLRFIHGFLDLVTVLFITRYRSRPLHMFGYLGLIFFGIGFLLGLYLTWVKFVGHQAIGERPLLLFSVMLMIMGVQIGITGIVSEHITAAINKNDSQYVIRKVLGKERSKK